MNGFDCRGTIKLGLWVIIKPNLQNDENMKKGCQ